MITFNHKLNCSLHIFFLFSWKFQINSSCLSSPYTQSTISKNWFFVWHARYVCIRMHIYVYLFTWPIIMVNYSAVSLVRYFIPDAKLFRLLRYICFHLNRISAIICILDNPLTIQQDVSLNISILNVHGQTWC